MDQKVKELWLEALRSGKYAQGKDALRIGDKFCCLGVLCDVYKKAKNDGEWVSSGNADKMMFVLNKDRSHAVLPSPVRLWAGLNNPNPNLTQGDFTSLATMNDSGRSFKDIANVIDKQL